MSLNTNLSTGVTNSTQIPVNAKRFALTLAELQDLGASDYKAFSYYEGQIVLCQEDERQYIWAEAASSPVFGDEGLISGGYTYPDPTVGPDGTIYTGRVFNWYPYKDVEVQETPFDRVISGNVYWSGTGLTMACTLMDYILNGIELQAAEQSVTLGVADVTNPRIDVLALDTSGNLVVVPGTPSPTPLEPQVAYGSQLKVGIVSVPANATIPGGVAVDQIYDENAGSPAEWNTSLETFESETPMPAPTDIAFNSTNDPDKNATNIEGTDVQPNTTAVFTRSGDLDILDLSSLAFEYKPKQSRNHSISIKLMNGSTVIAQLVVNNRDFGFDPFSTSYHTINIPINSFQILSRLSLINKITMSWNKNIQGKDIDDSIGFYMDDVRFIIGEQSQPGDDSFLGLSDVVENTYSRKKQYAAVVNESETGMELKPIPSFEDIYSPNGVIDGGVEHITGLTYRVWASKYIINGVLYTDRVDEQVTLDAADPTNDRFDVFVIENNGTGTYGAAFVKGTAAANPSIPNIDFATQAELHVKRVSATETTPPEVTTIQMYDENAGEPGEWSFKVTGAGMNSAYGSNPQQGSVSILLNAAAISSSFTIQDDVDHAYDPENTLYFGLRVTDGFTNANFIRVALQKDGVQTGGVVLINRSSAEKFGISLSSKKDINIWQTVAIDFALFAASILAGSDGIQPFDEIRFDYDVPAGTQLDNLRLQTGATTTNPTVPTKTSQLINDGENGSAPFLTQIPSKDNIVFVSSEDGNDATGALGNVTLPFATVAAALAALPVSSGASEDDRFNNRLFYIEILDDQEYVVNAWTKHNLAWISDYNCSLVFEHDGLTDFEDENFGNDSNYAKYTIVRIPNGKLTIRRASAGNAISMPVYHNLQIEVSECYISTNSDTDYGYSGGQYSILCDYLEMNNSGFYGTWRNSSTGLQMRRRKSRIGNLVMTSDSAVAISTAFRVRNDLGNGIAQLEIHAAESEALVTSGWTKNQIIDTDSCFIGVHVKLYKATNIRLWGSLYNTIFEFCEAVVDRIQIGTAEGFRALPNRVVGVIKLWILDGSNLPARLNAEDYITYNGFISASGNNLEWSVKAMAFEYTNPVGDPTTQHLFDAPDGLKGNYPASYFGTHTGFVFKNAEFHGCPIRIINRMETDYTKAGNLSGFESQALAFIGRNIFDGVGDFYTPSTVSNQKQLLVNGQLLLGQNVTMPGDTEIVVSEYQEQADITL